MKRQMVTLIALAAIMLFSSFGTVCAAGTIRVKGSDTMVILGAAWMDAYMKAHGGVDISVTGGGSGTGIAALIASTCEICEASRYMKSKEIQQCKDRNIMPVATAVALDGVSIAVNASNPIGSITIEQLRKIYTGEYTNWNQLGGSNAPIVALSRESSSGTYVYVQDTVLGGRRYSSRVLLLPSTKAIQQEVKHNANAIGYGGVAYFKNQSNIKILAVSAGNGKMSFMPADYNVRSGDYPLSRPLLFYTAGKPSGIIGDIVKFCLSPKGQRIVEQQGYVSLKAL